MEQCRQFRYIALELCVATLQVSQTVIVSLVFSYQIRNWDWTYLGARDKTWSMAIVGHPSSSAYPSILNSIAL